MDLDIDGDSYTSECDYNEGEDLFDDLWDNSEDETDLCSKSGYSMDDLSLGYVAASSFINDNLADPFARSDDLFGNPNSISTARIISNPLEELELSLKIEKYASNNYDPMAFQKSLNPVTNDIKQDPVTNDIKQDPVRPRKSEDDDLVNENKEKDHWFIGLFPVFGAG